MIDIEGPTQAVYTEEEKSRLRGQFILTVHTLLTFYLGLHNLIIPVVSNLIRWRNIFTDVHFWFLFQLPVQWWLRKNKIVPREYMLFLVFGTSARLFFELGNADELKSWSIFSLLLSELSSVIFYFIYWPYSKKGGYLILSFLGLFVPFTLSSVEIRSMKPSSPESHTVAKREDFSALGCEGSFVDISFPVKQTGKYTSEIDIYECGLEKQMVTVRGEFRIRNRENYSINLRIYRLHIFHGKVSWRFMRMNKLNQGKSWELSSLLKRDTAYLIKSPERRKLGHLILLPEITKDFPLGKGSLMLNYDSIEWRPHEREL